MHGGRSQRLLRPTDCLRRQSVMSREAVMRRTAHLLSGSYLPEPCHRPRPELLPAEIAARGAAAVTGRRIGAGHGFAFESRRRFA